MNFEGEKLKSGTSLNDNQDTKTSETLYQRDKLKLKIMDKFNVTPDEANKIILELQKKETIKHSKSETSKNKTSDNSSNSIPTNIPQTDITSRNKHKHNNHNQKSNHVPHENNLLKQNIIGSEKVLNHNNCSQNVQSNKINVDSIMSDIIPDYNNQISIELNHVDLTFEVQNEKTDTLKESFIRTLKRNKSKKFKIRALRDISFKIYKGEKIGIIGYNGAGKSTLLNVIAGIYSPDKGNVITHGNISPLLSLGAGFDHNFSGRKNIFLNGAVLGYDKNFLESKMDEIIEFSELGNFIDIPIKNYSSGMLAKLGFSIATAVNPDILIIDEILGVGDVNFKKKSSDKIKSLMDGGTTVILVSHSISQIRELCDKAIWINNGYLKDMGEVNTICDRYLKDAEKASNEQLANIELF